MTTDAKPKQISLKGLLVVVTAASVVLALYAAFVSVLGVLVVIWLAANVAYVGFSIYGFYIRRSQTDEWRSELGIYVRLGFVFPICLVFSILALLALPCFGLLVIAVVLTYIIKVSFEWNNGDRQPIRTSKLLWWLRFVVLGKAALFVTIIAVDALSLWSGIPI